MATTIPTGISIGAIIFLDMVSPTNKIKVPISAAVGINLLCLGPTNFLAI